MALSLLLAAVSELAGSYTVCLYFSPEAEPSTTVLVLEEPIESGAELSGSFYGSAFKEARFTTNAGMPQFFAITEDGSGEYFHGGTFQDDAIHGQTYSRGRDFLMPWTAHPGDDPCPER